MTTSVGDLHQTAFCEPPEEPKERTTEKMHNASVKLSFHRARKA